MGRFLSAEQLGELRRRLLTGFYATAVVVEETARRMLGAGDV